MRCAAIVGLLAAFGGVLGCGSDDAATGQSHREAREAMQRWAAAATPQAACDQLSYGYALFLADGDARDCSKRIGRRLDVTRAHRLKISAVVHRHGQEVVRAALDDAKPTDYYFVERDGVLKLNSIGIDIGPDTPKGPQDDPPRAP